MDASSTSGYMVRVQQLLTANNVFFKSIIVEAYYFDELIASVLGFAFDEVDAACSQINAMPQLANGFNAIGFDQGGLFLRAVVERCGLPVRSLVTMGTPHQVTHLLIHNLTIVLNNPGH
jgi:palmitoyl-protein thioesterase